MCDIVLSLLKGEFCILSIPSRGTHHTSRVPGETQSLPLTGLDASLFFGYEATIYVVLGSFSEERYSICSCQFVVSIEGKFRLFLCCRLKLLISMIHFTTDFSIPVNSFFLNYDFFRPVTTFILMCPCCIFTCWVLNKHRTERCRADLI